MRNLPEFLEALEATEKINDELCDQSTDSDFDGEWYYTLFSVELSIVDGMVSIKYLEYPLWNSEDDPRDYNDELDCYEDLYGYLKKEINVILKRMSQLKEI